MVIDASMALAWVIERAQLVEAAQAEALLRSCGEEAWVVPPLWHLEVINALVVAERRQVIGSGPSDRFLERLHALPIRTDMVPEAGCRQAVLTLARTWQLSAYDARYLELAQRLGGRLASFDRRLRSAAEKLDLAWT
ncbi:MAG: type II toxin-antitoxin system VapC family toxin [Prochlorococcaceae cyanobacterium]